MIRRQRTPIIKIQINTQSTDSLSQRPPVIKSQMQFHPATAKRRPEKRPSPGRWLSTKRPSNGRILVIRCPLGVHPMAAFWPSDGHRFPKNALQRSTGFQAGKPEKRMHLLYVLCNTTQYKFLQKRMHLQYVLCSTMQYKKLYPGSAKTCTAHACCPLPSILSGQYDPRPRYAQPNPAHQMNLHLIPRLFASNSRPRQVKRYEPLCGSCTPKGCDLLTCRGHPPLRGAFPLDPFLASRTYGREAPRNSLRSDAFGGRFEPDFPLSEATNFHARYNRFSIQKQHFSRLETAL